MTNRERLTILTIFVSILGYSFVSALKPVINSYVYNPTNLESVYSINNSYAIPTSIYYESEQVVESKIVNMLSEVLGIEKEDINIALNGGSTPSELLASGGVLLSDLSEEYSFDIVGEKFVKFRA